MLDLPDTKPETLAEGLRVLADYAGHLLLLPEEINRERGVILSEKLARDSADYRAAVAGYNHDGRIVAVVAGSGDAAKLKQVALHVASANPAPVALDRGSVDPVLVEKEKEIIAATPEVQAKPEAMRPKIVEGKLGRFFKESVLLEQEMLIDAEKGESVEKYAKRVGITVAAFGRLQAGS